MTTPFPLDGNPTALLSPVMPGIYPRTMIYDPTWDNPAHAAYEGQQIVPAVTSLVMDIDETPLWVIGVDPVTKIPSYTVVPFNADNDKIDSMLNYSNTKLRLYVDSRHQPYPVTPDSKCLFIGKSPRFYTLVRYPDTANEIIISQYFDQSGTLASNRVPLVALNAAQSQWYLPRSNVSVVLDEDEEIGVRIYNEDGAEVHSATLYVRTSAVINDQLVYAPRIVGMTLSANQMMANGVIYIYEKQDFKSLGIKATLLYDDGTTLNVPLDGVKCILYGVNDFIASFSGLTQSVFVKYFRSRNEAISSAIADPTGEMITTSIKVQVIPNTLGVTTKISVIPKYNSTLARYQMVYWMYFADGRSHIDVTQFISIKSGQLIGDASYFGRSQSYVIGLDMNSVDPVSYPSSAIYTQTVNVTLNVPKSLVQYVLRDSATSQYIYGLDNSSGRRPALNWDSVRQQIFIPSSIFPSKDAVLQTFYTYASPPYDPGVALVPQVPTHFVLRDVNTGTMAHAAPIAIDQYAQAITLINDTTGIYLNSNLIVEFMNIIDNTNKNVLYGVPVLVTAGSYIAPPSTTNPS
jgi:hypothetical protein